MWCVDVVSYHERGRVRPEGVRVIAHVHYACESYTGRHRGVHMTMAIRSQALRRGRRVLKVPSRHAVEESRTVSRRKGSKPLFDDGEQFLKRIHRDEGGWRRHWGLHVEVHAVRRPRPRDGVMGLLDFDARVEWNLNKREAMPCPERNRLA